MLFAAPLLLPGLIAAQSSPAPAPAVAAAPVHRHARAHKKPAAKHPAAQTAAAVTPAPEAPKPPDWPANDKPNDAAVVFDSHGLTISASNSSLAQILKQVATETGAKVEGMGADQRIFGTYGPGPARDVLSQLLDGSGYNVLLIGDRGEGTPRRIVLSPQNGAPAQANNSSAQNHQPSNDGNDEDQAAAEPQPPQEEPPPVQDGAPAVPVRTPQQLIQEIQERQRDMQQMQNGQQQNPQN